MVNAPEREMSYSFVSNLRDALPKASFIGFTGTLIEQNGADTWAVFGEYASDHDIQRVPGQLPQKDAMLGKSSG